MGYEIEFFPVGDSTKAGDAIVIRHGQPGSYEIIVVDGGTQDSGGKIVDHIRSVFGAKACVTHVVSTHPDTDHASGLRAVLEEIPVANLWIHGLWHHAAYITELFEGSWTADRLATEIRKEYPIIEECMSLARKQKANVFEPFAGQQIGPFTVLSPNKLTYQHLIPQFRKTPAPNQELLEEREIWLGDLPKAWSLRNLFETIKEAVVEWVPETWERELLRDGGQTAAENESSVVLFGDFGTTQVLLTADAGTNALTWACDNGQQIGCDPSAAKLVQVPHHGSRSNVSPAVLDRILGPKLPRGSAETKYAIASVPKDDEKHPRKMVINAFTRRGAGVRKTQGRKYRYHSGMPSRDGESEAVPFGFFDKVENYD